MKKIILISFAFLGLCCSIFPSFNSESIIRQNPVPPTTIMLVDSALATTIQCTKSGSIWSVTAATSTVAAYLARIGKDVFNNDSITNFQEIEVQFDSLGTEGSLSGVGTKDGSNVPIGVNYSFSSSSASGDVFFLISTDKHTCKGHKCECCVFSKEHHKIVGCACRTWDPCLDRKGNRCDHTITTN